MDPKNLHKIVIKYHETYTILTFSFDCNLMLRGKTEEPQEELFKNYSFLVNFLFRRFVFYGIEGAMSLCIF